MPIRFSNFSLSKLDISRLALICRTAVRRLRRRTRQQTLRFSLIATTRIRHWRVWLYVKVSKARLFAWALVPTLLVLAIGGTVFRHRFQWQTASETLANKGILSQLEIAVGAAMLGVIGIVFSLSIFSIQQVSERGTTLTLREYARDWVFQVVYWTLALFASLAMLSSLRKNESGLFRACLTFGILGGSFLILKVYFDRTMKFLDPHFTIAKVAKRAEKQLKQIQRLEHVVQSEIRHQRSRRRR
ncbi:Uncharacterised protein [uncultured archaeon]|nr:Uncharacterised protein [uncultured archaeon]